MLTSTFSQDMRVRLGLKTFEPQLLLHGMDTERDCGSVVDACTSIAIASA